MSENKVLVTESTKEVLEDELKESLDEMEEAELVSKINESGKAVASVTESGEVKVRRCLNG